MTPAEAIYRRKATRRFSMIPLVAEQLAEIDEAAKSFGSLTFPANVSHRILSACEVRSPMVRAPHFLAISAPEAPVHLENVGFVYQQLDLWLQARGLGSHWVAMAKPKVDVADHVICLAFGGLRGKPYRDTADFKRLPLEEISTPADPRLEPARLAPSGINAQPWRFNVIDDEAHVLRKLRPSVAPAMFTTIDRISMGIALAHLYVANPDRFNFSFILEDVPTSGHEYLGKVTL
jgi:hypothetical protein